MTSNLSLFSEVSCFCKMCIGTIRKGEKVPRECPCALDPRRRAHAGYTKHIISLIIIEITTIYNNYIHIHTRVFIHILYTHRNIHTHSACTYIIVYVKGARCDVKYATYIPHARTCTRVCVKRHTQLNNTLTLY